MMKSTETQRDWDELRRKQTVIKSPTQETFGCLDASHKLVLLRAYEILHNVLLQLRDEGKFSSKVSTLKALMDGSKTALPWVDFEYVDKGRQRRDAIAKGLKIMAWTEQEAYIDAIEQELISWEIIRGKLAQKEEEEQVLSEQEKQARAERLQQALDELDEVLEEDTAEFVRNYVQKPGFGFRGKQRTNPLGVARGDYRSGYQMGSMVGHKEVESEEMGFRRAGALLRQGTWVSPLLTKREDFILEASLIGPDTGVDRAAWWGGYLDGRHVGQVEAGVPCGDPYCPLCKQQPSNARDS